MAPLEGPNRYEELRDLAVETAQQAGDWLVSQFGGKIATIPKGDDSLVTALDVESERMIVEKIRSTYPEHTIIGEETAPYQPAGPCSWAVDPIDGTRNFASGIPLWAVSIAAIERGKPVAAAIYMPVTGEMYQAAEGEGTWLNGRRVSVSATGRLSEAVVMTDLLPKGYPQGLPGSTLGGLVTAARRTRMLGSVCCGLCYVAAGRFDLYYRPHVNLWDVAAGVLLVREAEGEVRSFEGDEWRAGANSILAANPALVEQLTAERRRLQGLDDSGGDRGSPPA